MKSEEPPIQYRGRVAPSPTGLLHLGHAMTFWKAQARARSAGGALVLRMEDLDSARCRPHFAQQAMDDLRWFGLRWDEGPDNGGAYAPYWQSERRAYYLRAWETLRAAGFIYPCICSRKDMLEAASAPHEENTERVYPGTCRRRDSASLELKTPGGVNWRFRVPAEEVLRFADECAGPQQAVAGRDFGDFVVWRRDDVPAYQLAVVVDDAAMHITEVVRGEDLLISTFRQLLLYRALGLTVPRWYHVPLLFDAAGHRLAKRHASLTLRARRERGDAPHELRAISEGQVFPGQ